MDEAKRKNFTGDFKVGWWKKELQEQASSLFDVKRGSKPAGPSASPGRLYSEIGRLMMELDWLKKSLESANRST